MSRVHPGTSDSYATKLRRRKERTLDREILRRAKIRHVQEFGEGVPIDRVKIRRFKKQLKSQLKKGEIEDILLQAEDE